MLSERFQHLVALSRKRIPPTPDADLRLHRLEKPEPWPRVLLDKIAGGDFHKYPDYGAFYRRLARYAGVSPDNIVVGQGIEGLIRDLFMLCCDPGDTVVFTYPTCAMFDIYANVFQAKAHHVIIDPKNVPTIEQFIASLPETFKLLILPNPGQPVDLCFSSDELKMLAEACEQRNAVLAIDQAYAFFGADIHHLLPLEHKNVVSLLTFSKAYGGAGLRVGFAIAAGELYHALNGVRQSGEVAGPSMAAVMVLLDNFEEFVLPWIADVVAARQTLVRDLQQAGLWVRGNCANHVLVDMGNPGFARVVAEQLVQTGVHIRVNAAPLDRYLMITCGSQKLMQQFFNVFSRVALVGRDDQ